MIYIITVSSQKKELFDNAEKVLDSHEHEFKKYNINSSGVGYKTSNDGKEKQIAIVFTVKKKKSTSELLSEGVEPIPAYIEGIPTSVEERPEGYTLQANGNI